MSSRATLFTTDGTTVRCTACSHHCTIAPGRKGICAVRENKDGALQLLVYGTAVGLHADPIEKKPLYHFLPGTQALSFGTVGCNFRCSFCQNWDLSQASKHGAYFGDEHPPEELVQLAEQAGCASIAYTYNEPTIFIEYARDTAKLAHARGLKNLFVSNGYETEEALAFIEPYLDAINIDLKAFTDAFYRKHCGARLQPVLDTIRRVAKTNIWLEITTLIIPGLNDSDEELRHIARFIASIDPAIPWHLSRFYPHHQLRTTAPTPLATLERAWHIGTAAGLQHVYLGNAPDADERYTASFCPRCGAKLLTHPPASPATFTGRCPSCDTKINGVWN